MLERTNHLAFFILESKGKINIKDETTETKKEGCVKNIKKQQQQKKNAKGYFLNRYDFAYAGRDTVSQLGKVAPGIIKNASSEINNIA